MSVIIAIAQICSFHTYFASTPDNKAIMSKISQESCLAYYQTCMDDKRNGTWAYHENELTGMLWRCMKEKRL